MEQGLVSELSSSLMEEALEFRMAILAASLACIVAWRRWCIDPRLRVGDWLADRLEWIVS